MRRLPAHLPRLPDLVLRRLPAHPETEVVLRSRKQSWQQDPMFIRWICLLTNVDTAMVKELEVDNLSEAPQSHYLWSLRPLLLEATLRHQVAQDRPLRRVTRSRPLRRHQDPRCQEVVSLRGMSVGSAGVSLGVSAEIAMRWCVQSVWRRMTRGTSRGRNVSLRVACLREPIAIDAALLSAISTSKDTIAKRRAMMSMVESGLNN